MIIKRLAHACLFSTDLERTEKFYCGTLGMRLKFPFLRDGQRVGFYLEIGDRQFIEVFLRDNESSPPNSAPRIGHLCLETDDIQALTVRLREHGIQTRPAAPVLEADATWQIWCQDPDGTDLEFQQYTPESLQVTGRACMLS